MGSVYSMCCVPKEQREKDDRKSLRSKRISQISLNSNESIHRKAPRKRPSRTSVTSRTSVCSRKSLRNEPRLSKMTIHEDSVLEALCEQSNIELPTNIKKRGISVSKKARKKIFNKFGSAQELQSLVNENSHANQSINQEIRRISERIQTQSLQRSESVHGGCDAPRTSLQRNKSVSSRHSINALLGQASNTTNVDEILARHREKIINKPRAESQSETHLMVSRTSNSNTNRKSMLKEATHEEWALTETNF